MIQGVVNAAYEPMITLALQGPSGQSRDIEAVVDTGFNGFLTLPTVLVSELGLPFISIGRATLADGNEIAYEVYGVAMLWDGIRYTWKPTPPTPRPWWVCCSWTGTT